MKGVVDVLSTGLFAAAVYFLVAAGLQVIFGI
jgi:branched-subunit amino acid ABC-type transport system permease component